MAASSSSSSSTRTWKYDVFPSFRGEDVRKTFLSHLVKELKSKSINTFIDNGIERSHLIADELLSAIRESRISIVVLSKNYVSSTWCLNELAEIHECFKEMNQMVIPVFYELDPSHVKKQTGEFGKTFDKTCEGKTEDQKQRWVRALAEIATIAGYDSRNWSGEAEAIELISKDVLNKLMLTPSDDFRDFVGIGAHVDAIMDSKLCLETGGVRMVGIVGPSGIGKTTIARALYSRLSSSQFEHRAFASYKRTMQDKKIADFGMKLSWAKHFLSEILCQKDIKIESLGVVEQRLKHRKVLIVLDDVDEIELLETLVGKVEWFGFGSRIVVVTQDRALLKSREIDLIYEVQFPSGDLALQMFCQSAFGKASPPDGFMELAAEVANLSGNLPLGLNVLGSSLRKKNKEYWVEMMPRLRNGLNGKIEKTLRLCYDGLDEKDDQDIFVYIACLFNGESVSYIKNMLEKSCYTSVNTSLRTLADKSLARITTQDEIVQMHILLEKLGREIVRSESINNPGKRRFLVDPKDIFDVFNDNIGTKNVLGIRLDTSEINEPLFIDDKSFEGMRNLRFIKFSREWWPHETREVRICLPHQGLIYFPRKLILLHWDDYPAKFIPSNFKAEHLVELIMEDSKLEKLWEGAQPFRSLKAMNLSGSRDLKEIPDFSNATNLEILNFSGCTSLVTLPSSIRNLKKLIDLRMSECSKLEVLPSDVNLESLDYLDLRGCSKLRSFPLISRNISRLYLYRTAMEEEDCYWIENLSRLTVLEWENCPLRCMPPKFHPEHLTKLSMINSKLEKLWEGVESLTKLTELDLVCCESLKEIPDLSNATSLSRLCLSECITLTEIPDLSKATNLEELDLSECKSLKEIPDLPKVNHLEILILDNCTSLVKLPSSIQHLDELDLSGCITLKEIPDLSNALHLKEMNLSGCKSLEEITDFPKANHLERLILENCTSLVKLPSSIQHLEKLERLSMGGCTSLKVLPTNINLVSLTYLDLSRCSRLRTFPQLSTSIEELNLSNTAIEEVPSWIENIVGLSALQMSGCTSLEVLPTNVNLVSLTYLDLSGCSRLRTFPQFSMSIEYLNLSDTAIEEVPSWIENIVGLSALQMSRCTSLEVLPTNINLVSVTTLDLSGCSRLRTFPQISTSIEELNLSNTAIEAVPSWIENIVGLTYLQMRGCEKLKEISANIWNLKHIQCVDFTGGVTLVSDTILVKTVAELHEEMYLSCSDLDTEFLFHNCSDAISPGKKVPTYFTHRAPGSSLTVPLPQSSLSQNRLRFTAYIIPNPNLPASGFQYVYETIIVHWKFRGAQKVISGMGSAKMDPLLVFHFNIFFQEDPPSQLDCENVEFEFKYHLNWTSNIGFQTSFLLPIKECGVRVLDVFPSLDASDRSSEAEYTNQDEESDEESGRSKKRMRMTVEPSQVHSNLPGGKTAVSSGSMAPCVEEEARSSGESGRSKKRMRMTVETPEENSNSLCGQTAVNSG